MSQTKHFRTLLERQRGEQSRIQSTIDRVRQDIRALKHRRRDYERAREIVRLVGLKTQEQLQYHISDITTLAMEAVFDNPYALSVEFVQRRNKSECDLLFERDGERVEPTSASGGGTVDVASFALRIASWSMQNPRSRNVIIMDEPLRFLSEQYQPKASLMIKELSERLNLQFIIITHETALSEHADRIFQVRLKNKVSNITIQQ